jgi:hypothetical protein
MPESMMVLNRKNAEAVRIQSLLETYSMMVIRARRTKKNLSSLWYCLSGKCWEMPAIIKVEKIIRMPHSEI